MRFVDGTTRSLPGRAPPHKIRAPVLIDRRVTNAFWITGYGFDGDSAKAIVASGDAVLVAFGRHFTSNPDLPYRLKHKLPLTPYVRAAF